MHRTISILIAVMFISLSAAEAKQLSEEQIEQILFDFRVGVDWKIKEKGVQRLVWAGEEVVPILIECLKEQLPEQLAKRIEEAYRKEGERLLVARADGSSIPVQGWAETTLIRIGKTAVPKLIASIYAQPETVPKVARILGKIGDKRAVSPIITVLNDKNNNWWVRACAAESIGNLGSPEAIPHLIEALNGHPNDPYNNGKFLNSIANSLTQLSGHSFGFTLVFSRSSKAGDLSPDYFFKGNQSEKEKAIKKWKEWWQEYNEVLVNVPMFLDTYSNQLKNGDMRSILKSRSVDYIQRVRNVVIEDRTIIWLNRMEQSPSSLEQPKCMDYQILCKDIKTEQDLVIVFAEDNVLLDFDGQRRRFTAQTTRVLIKKENSCQIKQENLSMWQVRYVE